MTVLRAGEAGLMSMMARLLSVRPANSLFTFLAMETPFGVAPVGIVWRYRADGVETSKMSTPPEVRSPTYMRWAA